MERQGLDLQKFSRTTSLTPVADLGSPVSVRNLPNVQDVGTQAEVQMYESMANDSYRLANISSDQFDRELQTVKKMQALEEEGRFADFTVDLQQAVTEAQLNSQSSETIVSDVNNAYESVYNKYYGEGTNISDFQREYISGKLDSARTTVAKGAYEYQLEVRSLDAQEAFKKVFNSNIIAVQNNPALLGTMLDGLDNPDNPNSISSLMDGVVDEVTQRQIIASAKNNLYKASALSFLDKSPSKVLDLLKTDEYKNNLDASTYAAVKSDAKAALEAARKEELAKQDRIQRIQTDIDLDRLSRGELEPERASMYTYANAEEKYKTGEWTSTTYNKAVSALDKIREDKDNEFSAISLGKELINSGYNVYEKEHKDALNAYHQYEVNQIRESFSNNPKAIVDGTIESGLKIYQSNGVFPDSFIKPIVSGLKQAEPESVFMAQEIEKRLRARGMPVSPFSAEELGVLKAAEKASLLYPGNDEKARQERTRIFNDELRQAPGRDIAMSKIDDFLGKDKNAKLQNLFKEETDAATILGFSFGGMTAEDMQIPLESQAILYDEIKSDAIIMMQSGNVTAEDAMRASVKKHAAKIGSAAVNNEQGYMPYAPVNPYQDAGAAWMRQQIKDTALKSPDYLALPDDVKGKFKQDVESGTVKLKIRQNPATAQTWVNTNGTGASYTLIMEDENGVVMPLVEGFKFDYSQGAKQVAESKGNYKKNREYVRKKYLSNPMQITPGAYSVMNNDEILSKELSEQELDRMVSKAEKVRSENTLGKKIKQGGADTMNTVLSPFEYGAASLMESIFGKPTE